MTQHIDSKELLEMKEQMALLKQKLEKETIIHEQLMRKVMKVKADSLRTKAILESILALTVIPVFTWVMHSLFHFSIALCLFFGIVVTCAQIYSYYIHHHFRPKDFINNSVIEAKKGTLRLKTYYANWLKYISIPFDITFLTWFIYEAIQLSQANSTSTIIFSISFVVIFITVFILAMGQYFKIQRTADEIISHIEELCRLNEKKL
jgi:glucan phosphoethanolaminetransferase (alkaline phosphatase superfamily)